jgi:hypothetical protein
MNWHAGQEVVVVASLVDVVRAAWVTLRKHGFWPVIIRRNQVYVVDRVELHWSRPFLKLHSVPRAVYTTDFFRPAFKAKNDISIFTAILDRVNRREVVDA